MSSHWISISNRLIEGVKLINLLPLPKFRLLLKHANESDGAPVFTEADLNRLAESLGIGDTDAQLLAQSLAYIWKQSTRVILKPTVLQRTLAEDLQLDSEKAEEFVRLWTERTKADIGDLERRKKLENISWQLNLQAASTINHKESVPKARIQLQLSDFIEAKQSENVTLDLNEEQLLKLYSTLEKIQVKLDNIQNVSK